MLTVEVFALRDGNDHREGTLSWDGEKVVCDPRDSSLLQNIAARLPEGGDGEAFLRGLWRVYNGSYLRVSPAKEIEKKTEGQPSR